MIGGISASETESAWPGARLEQAGMPRIATHGASKEGEEKTTRGAVAETDEAGLTEAEQDVVRKLKERDSEVRAHEAAHAQVGGQYAGSPSYTYQTGPDGGRYAIGGEVPIDISPVKGDPDATIRKMEIVKAAALAPAEPSSADRQIASTADAQRLAAIAERARMDREGGDEPEKGLASLLPHVAASEQTPPSERDLRV